MEQGWYYAEGEGSVGPLSFDALTSALRRAPEQGRTLVWRSGFADWRAAHDVPELAERLFKRLPDVVTLDPRMDRWSASDPGSEEWEGDGLPQVRRRRWPTIVAIAVVLAILAGGGIYASRTGLVGGEAETRVVLPAASAPEAPKQEAARADPATILAKLTETAAQAAAATEALSRKLWAEIEPPNMQPPDYATASRADIENNVHALRTAEANVTEAYNKYTALQKAERELIEESVRSSALDEAGRTEFLTQLSDRQNASLELITRMLQSRIDLYRAMQRMQGIAIEQFGKYKSGPEGLRFTNKAAGDRFGVVAAEVNEASKRLDLAEDRILQQARPWAPQPGWQGMVTQQPVTPGTKGQ